MDDAILPSAARIAAVLGRARDSRTPVVCTGRGASLALADGFATSLRALGLVAFAVTAAEAEKIPSSGSIVCAVSRTAWLPRRGAEVLVTEACDLPASFSGLAVRVDARGEPSTAWFPVRYIRAAIHALSRVSGVGEPFAPATTIESERRNILVLPSDAHPAARLLSAATHKLGDLDLVVTDVGEFGHGLHARVHAAPQLHVVHDFVSDPGDEDIIALEQWCRDVGVEYRAVPLPRDASSARALVGLLAVLDSIEARCLAMGIDPARRPLPDRLDTLRVVGAGKGVSSWT